MRRLHRRRRRRPCRRQQLLARAVAAPSARSGAPVLSNQVQYSLAVRKPDAELVPYAHGERPARHRVQPARQGTARPAATTRRTCRPTRPALYRPVVPARERRAAHDLIETVRARREDPRRTPSQVALAWVVSHPNVVAIPGASSVAQLESNVAAADLDLSADEIAELTAASDRFTTWCVARRARQDGGSLPERSRQALRGA